MHLGQRDSRALVFDAVGPCAEGTLADQDDKVWFDLRDVRQIDLGTPSAESFGPFACELHDKLIHPVVMHRLTLSMSSFEQRCMTAVNHR